jgi:expansin (peptidoglycan-binding protein)
MKTTLFALLPLAGFAFAESSCDAQRKTSTQYEYETVTASPVGGDSKATPEAIASSSCSRRTVTTTEVEKVTVTVDASGKPPKTIDVTSTSTKHVKTTVTIRPSGASPAASVVASSLRWSNYRNATYHASSSAPATPTSQLPDFSIIGQEAAAAALTSSTAMPTSEAAASSAAPSTPAPSVEAGSDNSMSTSAAGSKRGEATFYGGNTAGGMCSFTGYTIPSSIYGTALSDANWDSANACGQCVSVTGPDGKTKVTAMVVDQCPGCGSNHLDLYPDAFAKLADPSKGIINVSWDYVPCGISSPIKLKNKSGTSKFWFSMQVMNANVGVTKLEVSTDNGATWKATTRKPYNFFENPAGFGSESVDVRVTGVNGKMVVTKGVSVASNSIKEAGGNL